VAKEGVFPFSLWFAKSYDLSLKRLFGMRPPEENLGVHFHTEKTPAATMALHWIIMTLIVVPVVYIVKPTPYTPNAAYTFLVTFYDYCLDVFWFAVMGFGLLYLRLWPGTNWRKTSTFNPWVSIICAMIFVILNTFPVIGLWIHDRNVEYLAQSNNTVAWYTGQTLAASVLVFSIVYWFFFWGYVRLKETREGKNLIVEREPIFRMDDNGEYVQIYEIVGLEWKMDPQRISDTRSNGDIDLQRY
jgi:hypothetical protein